MSVTFLKTNNRGVTIMETILYMVILTFVMSVVVQMLISISGMYRTMKVTRELESSGTIAMERILREIRNASSVIVDESDFGINPGSLTISGADEDFNPYKIKFDVSSGILQITKDSEEPVALTSSSGVVSYLLFTHLATSTSEAIRVEMEMSENSDPVPKSEKFYGFAVLRGSY